MIFVRDPYSNRTGYIQIPPREVAFKSATKHTADLRLRCVLLLYLLYMENEIIAKLQAQDVKLDAIFKSVEKTRRYFQIIFWITVLTVLLPLLGLLFVVPVFMKSYMSQFEGLL